MSGGAFFTTPGNKKYTGSRDHPAAKVDSQRAKGGGKRTIKTNDKVTFYWVIVSSRDPACKVGR